MNTTAKGNRKEREFMGLLESRGFKCDRKNHARYSSPDFFGMFDIVAIKGSVVNWYQIKSTRGDWLGACKDIQMFLRVNRLRVNCYCYYRVDGGRWYGRYITQDAITDIVS